LSIFSTLFRKPSGKKPLCAAVIAAAGCSQRIDGEDKLFLQIMGAPVLAHTLIAFQNCDCISEIIVVAREERFEYISEICEKYNISKTTKIMVGGVTRLESVMNGLLAVSNKTQLVAIHDGARPCVDKSIIESTVAAAGIHNAAAPGVAVSSTFKRTQGGTIAETVDRENLIEIQTPQVFRTELIKAALTNAANKSVNVTDDCMAAELIGVKIIVTEGSRNNIKLTTSEDILITEAILASRELCQQDGVLS